MPGLPISSGRGAQRSARRRPEPFACCESSSDPATASGVRPRGCRRVPVGCSRGRVDRGPPDLLTTRGCVSTDLECQLPAADLAVVGSRRRVRRCRPTRRTLEHDPMTIELTAYKMRKHAPGMLARRREDRRMATNALQARPMRSTRARPPCAMHSQLFDALSSDSLAQARIDVREVSLSLSRFPPG
jgi:hypothetical protein